MSIQVLNISGFDAGVFKRIDHGATRAIHVRCGDVIGVGAHAVTNHFRINLGTTSLGVLILFQHHDASALAQHETVAVLVPRPAGRGRIIVSGRQRTRSTEAAHTQRGYG